MCSRFCHATGSDRSDTINGLPFKGLEGFTDFLQFNHQKLWTEVLRDQTFMIKIDYWFEK